MRSRDRSNSRPDTMGSAIAGAMAIVGFVVALLLASHPRSRTTCPEGTREVGGTAQYLYCQPAGAPDPGLIRRESSESLALRIGLDVAGLVAAVGLVAILRRDSASGPKRVEDRGSTRG